MFKEKQRGKSSLNTGFGEVCELGWNVYFLKKLLGALRVWETALKRLSSLAGVPLSTVSQT